MKPMIASSSIQPGLAAGASVEIDIPLPHGFQIGLSPVFLAVRTLGGSEGAVLSASVVTTHDKLAVRIVNSGTGDAKRCRVDAMIVAT
jgi:hypothetical protein